MRTKLKIYAVDLGWRGSIIVVAESMDEAREIMEKEANYKEFHEGTDEKEEITEHKIVKGFKWTEHGDM